MVIIVVGGQSSEKLRLDKWLWQARFFKTRTLAARQVSGGHVRVNGERVSKPAFVVAAGDVLTFAQSRQVRVIQVVAIGTPAMQQQDQAVGRLPLLWAVFGPGQFTRHRVSFSCVAE